MAAHSYWRIRVTQGTAPYDFGEIEFRATLGGADEATGGTALSSSGTAANAFDDNTGTLCTLAALNDWVGYQFASAVDIKEVVVTCPDQYDSPVKFAVEWSDDGSTWTTLREFYQYTSDWGLQPTRRYDLENGHTFWRIKCEAAYGYQPRIGEIEFRTTVGGADITGFQGAIASSEYSSSYYDDYAFDNNAATYWEPNQTEDYPWIGNRLAYGAADIAEVVITNGDRTDKSLRQFVLEYSDDGTTWTPKTAVYGEAVWSAGETRTFATPAPVPDTPPEGAHRWWRMNVSTINSGLRGICAELQLRGTPGGAQLCDPGVNGVIINSTQYMGFYEPARMMDGDTATDYRTLNGAPFMVGFLFDTATEVQEFAYWTGQTSGKPVDFTIEYSDDGVTWIAAKTYTGESMTVSAYNTYGAVAEPPPPPVPPRAVMIVST